MRRRALSLLAASALVAPRLARAAWPERPLTMIVAFAAGGGTDTAARTIARFLERDLGQSVVVLNRPGAGGEIGFSELARARPDGYTIGFINTPNIVTVPIERQARYRLEDFSPVANIVDDPGGVFVHRDSPIRTLPDLIERARAAPGTLSYGSTGIGSDDHLAMLALERLTGARFLHVPFGGSSQVRTATLGGQLSFASMNMAEGVADLRSGMLRALGQMGATRWSVTPDVATFREQGFDVIEGSMRGIAAPAGMAPDVLERLAGALRKVVDDPEFGRAAVQQSLPLRYLGPDEYRGELFALRDAYQRLWGQHPWRE